MNTGPRTAVRAAGPCGPLTATPTGHAPVVPAAVTRCERTESR